MRYLDDIKKELDPAAKKMLGQNLLGPEESEEAKRLSALILEFMQATTQRRYGGGGPDRADKVDIEQLASDAAFKAVRSFHDFQGGTAACSTWCTRILINEAQNAHKTIARRGRILRSEGQIEWEELPSAQVAPPAESLLEAERKAQVDLALNQLEETSPDQAHTLRAFYENGLTHEAISQQHSVELGTVKSRHHRGLGKIEKILKAQGLGPEDIGPSR